MEQRTRLQNRILTILAVMTAAFAVLLFYHRSQPGIQFRGAFLKQEIRAENTVYYGKCKGEQTAIYVTEKTAGTLVQILAGERRWDYLVSTWEGGSDYHASPDRIPVVIADGNGQVIFKGYFSKWGHLSDENGEIDRDDFGIYVYTEYEHKDPWEDYTPSKIIVSKLALAPDLVSRGSVGMFLLVLLITLIVAVDVLYPEFFFQLKHCMSVRDPEPSDFYIAMQKLGWMVYPVLIAVGYWYAATALPT